MASNLEEDNKPEFIVLRPFSRLGIAISLVFLLFLSGASWYYYEYKYLPRQPIETLEADCAIPRIKPDKPGGALVPNTDKLVYDNIKSGKNIEGLVSIMPDPEEPIKITQKENPSDGDSNKIDDIILNILSSSEAREVNIENTEAESAEAVENNNVEAAVVNEETTTKKLNIIPVEESSKPKKKAHVQNKTYYRLQLASVRTESGAIKEWQRLKKLYPKHLESLSYKVEKVTVENKGVFYRLLVGSFTNFSKAKALCKKMSHKYQSCTIINN